MAIGAVQARRTDAFETEPVRLAGLEGVDTGAAVNEPMKARRLGEPVPASVTTLGVAALMMAPLTLAGAAVGFDCRYNAAIPAT